MNMKLTAEQAEGTPFPIGCPVWYNFPLEKTVCDEGAGGPSFLKQGVVESVSFDFMTKDLLYKVVYKDEDVQKGDIAEEVSEHKLAYGANCPVMVDCNEDETQAEDGTVLMCEPSSSDRSKMSYTVMVFMEESQARYEHGVGAERLRYRGGSADATDTDARAADVALASARENTELPTANKSIAADHPSKEPVPSSITCDSAEEKGTTSSTKHARAPDAASPLSTNRKKNLRLDMAISRTNNVGSCREDNHESINSYCNKSVSSSSHDQSRFEIKTPHWLQRDRESQKDLYFHLIGSNDSGSKQNLKDIEHETNCSITVNTNDKHKHSWIQPITISVHVRAQPILRYRQSALKKIQDLLLDYVGSDGSRGRLLCEVASSCSGSHRPKDSQCKVVRAKHPFAKDDRKCWMATVELPFDESRGKKTFHVDFLRLNYIEREAECHIEACVHRSDFPVKLCYPYLLVTGRKAWRDVDRAVEIINQAIKKHMHTCSCMLEK